jgi:hypothetical protein
MGANVPRAARCGERAQLVEFTEGGIVAQRRTAQGEPRPSRTRAQGDQRDARPHRRQRAIKV